MPAETTHRFYDQAKAFAPDLATEAIPTRGPPHQQSHCIRQLSNIVSALCSIFGCYNVTVATVLIMLSPKEDNDEQ